MMSFVSPCALRVLNNSGRRQAGAPLVGADLSGRAGAARPCCRRRQRPPPGSVNSRQPAHDVEQKLRVLLCAGRIHSHWAARWTGHLRRKQRSFTGDDDAAFAKLYRRSLKHPLGWLVTGAVVEHPRGIGDENFDAWTEYQQRRDAVIERAKGVAGEGSYGIDALRRRPSVGDWRCAQGIVGTPKGEYAPVPRLA